jgi:hypothetical protein
MADPGTWLAEVPRTTALFVTYDEHDGYFDHVLPLAPDASQKNEFVDGLPIGFGSRVPMIIASPLDPRRLRGFQHVQPHLDAPVPGDLDRGAGPQHHRLAAVSRR